MLDAFEVLLGGKKELPAEVLADLRASGHQADPLGLTARGFGVALVEVGQAAGYQTSDFAEAIGWAGGLGGRSGGFLMDNILAHSSVLMEQAYQEQRASQAAYLANNLKALSRAPRGIEGPKHLVLLSQGFDASLLEVNPGISDVGSGGGSWLPRTVNDMIHELRAAGWVIHGADLGGIASTLDRGEAALMKASLFYLADETGGALVENTNDLAVGLADVIERTHGTYVLTFQVEGVAEDGAFHPIRVELVHGPRRARLVHRTGFHAPRPPGEREPFELRAAAAARILAGDEVGGLPTAVRATVLSYSGERARVPVLVEVAGGGLLEGGSTDGGGGAELYVYAFDGAGAVAGFFAHSVTLDAGSPAGDAAGWTARGVKLAGELELPPLFMQGASERWTVAALGDGEAGEPYPFVVEGRRIAPAAVPVLAPGQAVKLLLPGVGLSEEGVTLETRIVTETGEPVPVPTGQVRILGRRPPEAGQPDLLVAELDAAGLDPGSYRLEVTLTGTGHRVTAPFRVED